MLRQLKVSLLITVLLITNNVVSTQSNTNKQINEQYLQNIMKNMDPRVDPCDDFFSYACGNWAQNYNSTEYLDMPGYMDNKVNQQLLELLQQHRHTDDIYKKLWNYYESCEKLKQPALNYYLRLVQPELNITWPIFRADWNEAWSNAANFSWLTTIAKLRWYGLNGVFITQNLNVRLYNGSHHILELHGHQNSYELREKDILEIFKNFGMTEEESLSVTEKIIDLEKRMQNLTLWEVESNHPKEGHFEKAEVKYEQSFVELTVQELSQNVTFIDWNNYFHIILGREVNASSEMVQLFSLNLNYFERLRDTLAQSTNETIAYYVMLKFMYTLNEDLPDAKLNSMKCIKHLRAYMPLAMNYIYEAWLYRGVRKETDAALLEIYAKLKQRFRHLVEENKLGLNTTERAFVLEELNSMVLKIGNIPLRLSSDFVQHYYERLTMHPTNFYANHLQLLRHNTWRHLEGLSNQATLFFHHDPETASSSSPVKIFTNAILVPYGYLQMPLFHSELSALFQYSLFGFILAHEILHAFDLFHIVYDRHGNYNVLGVAVAQHFWPHLECLAEVAPGENLSENIADISGLRLVYHTFFDDVVNSVNDDDDDKEFFNTSNLTSPQLFFVNSVQFLCANMGKISSIDLKDFNLEHDMHDVRVLQNWALFEEFAVAFKCRGGAKMKPQKNCRLW